MSSNFSDRMLYRLKLRQTIVLICGCLISANALAQTQPTCPTGFQPYANRCISQRMADYISCVQASGGNSERIATDVTNANAGKTDVGVAGSGSGVVVKGSGSVTVDRATEQALASKFEHTWTDKGMEECRKVLDPPARSEDALVKEAQQDWRTDNRTEAIREFQQASELNSDDYLPHKCLGFNFASNADFDSAAKEYELALHASNAPAELEEQLKLLNENRDAANKALELVRSNPDDVRAHLDLGKLLLKLKPVGAVGGLKECDASLDMKKIDLYVRRKWQTECSKAENEADQTVQSNPSAYAGEDCGGK